jgi:hypothetical protein
MQKSKAKALPFLSAFFLVSKKAAKKQKEDRKESFLDSL